MNVQTLKDKGHTIRLSQVLSQLSFNDSSNNNNNNNNNNKLYYPSLVKKSTMDITIQLIL